jgi:hypothetical protein
LITQCRQIAANANAKRLSGSSNISANQTIAKLSSGNLTRTAARTEREPPQREVRPVRGSAEVSGNPCGARRQAVGSQPKLFLPAACEFPQCGALMAPSSGATLRSSEGRSRVGSNQKRRRYLGSLICHHKNRQLCSILDTACGPNFSGEIRT